MTDLSGFVLETIHEDGELILSRRVGGDEPTLLLAPVLEQPGLGSIKRLEHEYFLRDELDPAWAVRPRALIRNHGRLMLLLDDPGGEVLARLLGQPWDIKGFMHTAIGVAVALRRVHERGLIHKDVKLANVLVHGTTGEVRLTRFGIASRQARERHGPQSPETIAGTWAYMAPEQTGRMNRSLDARSDLYALGVTLYELFSGSLPFTATEPMEWIHCHIAKKPIQLSERAAGIPETLAQIVMKLLAKAAEERYQTAAGVEADLRTCLADWESVGRMDQFPLGRHDVSDRLLIPEKLYGRESNIDTLVTAFNRVAADGRTELVLVSGYSGIGKSSVVNELHKALVPSRGLFASGKFDPYHHDIPYATLAQALRSLVSMILGQGEAELRRWRSAISQAVGPNWRLPKSHGLKAANLRPCASTKRSSPKRVNWLHSD